TSFDSGYHAIPPFKINIKSIDDSTFIESNALLLAVNNIEILPEEEIRDIKPPIDTPITWQELFKKYWKIGLLIILLLGAAVSIWWYIKKRKETDFIPQEIEIPKISPEIKALEELAILKKDKTWLDKSTKPYFSSLTDIIRVYIHGRYQLNAMEMTTEEILDCLERIQIGTQIKSQLSNILRMADGVKFAKQKPLVQECEICLTNAFEFVNKTTPIETPKEAPINVSPE
ncbi:MAG: hypothetical protein HRT72_06650, partial [Flavobacteriales bacterium]|nr:hypothetical protein [Flavobacteriales bacterium]